MIASLVDQHKIEIEIEKSTGLIILEGIKLAKVCEPVMAFIQSGLFPYSSLYLSLPS